MENKTLMDKIKQGRQYRTMQFEVRKDEEQNEKCIVEGYATTYNDPYPMGENEVCRVLEQVSEKAFEKCDMSDVIFQYDHCGRVYARISNGTMKLESDEHGLKIIADLGGTEEGRKLYEEIKGGYTTRMSFGFIVRGDSEETRMAEDGKREYIRTITDISKLFDVSAVSLPANDGTEISARSYCEGVFAEMEKRLQDEEAQKKAEEEKRMAEEKAKAEQEAKEKELKERERLALELSFTL